MNLEIEGESNRWQTVKGSCAMFLAEIDRSYRLLKITVTGQVGSEDARDCLERLRSLLADIKPGFRLLTDLSSITSVPTTTAPYIGKIMELCVGKGVELVVRVLRSEPRNDIGYAILSQFHYGRMSGSSHAKAWRRR